MFKITFFEVGLAAMALWICLLLVGLAFGQPPAAPKIPDEAGPPPAPRIVTDQLEPMESAPKIPKIIFCKIPARAIKGCEVVRDDNWTPGPSVSLFTVENDEHRVSWRYAGNVNDVTIRRDLGLEVMAARPAPFPDPPVVEGEPWLSRAESDKVIAMIPAGVPVSKNLRFYKLSPVYQNMYTMNNGRSKFNVVTPYQPDVPWRDSGGLHHVDRKEWRNVTGLDLPGSIKLWQEDTDVRAFSLVPKWRWSFPKGTLAYDVLLRIKDGKEHVFEVRVHEKLQDEWDDGTIYRPEVTAENAERNNWSWGFSSEGLKASAVTFTSFINPKSKFVPAKKLVIDDGDFVPPNYVGAGMACNSCHSRVGEIVNVPGQIYRQARRGDDGRFSWHPFDKNGNIDQRWPVQRNLFTHGG